MCRTLLFIFAFLIHSLSFAQTNPENTAPANPQNEMALALAEAQKTAKTGPSSVALEDQATFNVPTGYVFIPSKEAGTILRIMGNYVGPGLQGIIFPEVNDNWFAVIQFEKSGYIKEDDAKDWKADDLLSSIKEGTETTNQERKARGIPEMEIIGWVERPRYDLSAHRLIWSISTKDKGGANVETQGVNYNTYALGREGFFSVNMITPLKEIETKKPIAQTLLSALEFNSGKRYADFDSSKDKVAEYGLAALVAGVAAKKLGFLALIGVFIAKFYKLIALGALALSGIAFKVFKHKKDKAVNTDKQA